MTVSRCALLRLGKVKPTRRRDQHGRSGVTIDGGQSHLKTTRWLNALLFVLVAGIGGQAALAVGRAWQASSRPASASGIVVGDTLFALVGNREGGVPTTIRLATDSSIATVLYVFHPDCVHCHPVAPEWAKRFSADRNNGSAVRSVAVTSDSIEPAVAYAERFGWTVDVLSVQELAPQSREYSLVSRTPWVFVFDSIGVLRYEGHGSRLDNMMKAITAL